MAQWAMPKPQNHCPNWDALDMLASRAYRESRRREGQATANATRACNHERRYIQAAGGDPDTSEGVVRASLVAAGRTIKRRASSQKQAHVKRLHTDRLRAAKPPWADVGSIQEVYAAADAATRNTGVLHEVDHVIPLLGRNVCGLHIAANLRVVTRSLNRAKGNRRPPD